MVETGAMWDSSLVAPQIDLLVPLYDNEWINVFYTYIDYLLTEEKSKIKLSRQNSSAALPDCHYSEYLQQDILLED